MEKYSPEFSIITYIDSSNQQVMKSICFSIPNETRLFIIDVKEEELTPTLLKCIRRSFNLGIIAYKNIVNKVIDDCVPDCCITCTCEEPMQPCEACSNKAGRKEIKRLIG